jgi:hypothetical protein
MGTKVAFAAFLMNAVMCAAWAAQVDTFIISNAVLAAALAVTMR